MRDDCDLERASAWVDGAIGGDEREAFARHLAGCGRCRRRVSALRAVAQRLAALPTHEAPSVGTERQLAALSATVTATPRRRRQAVTWTAAAALLAATIAIGLWTRAPIIAEALASQVALDHLHYVGRDDAAEVRGDAAEVGAFFARTLGVTPGLPSDDALRVVGARRCRIAGRLSPLVWFERAGQRLSLFELRHVPQRRAGCVDSAGVLVCAVPGANGGARILVGALPRSELLRLLGGDAG